jgi:hypothetical protein
MIVLGNKNLLNEKLALILNSSQSKMPCGNDPWIMQTARAVSEVIGNDSVIITSLDLVTWELVVHLTNVSEGRQIIICPASGNGLDHGLFDQIVSDFGLSRDNAAMLFVKHDVKARFPKETWQRRDAAAAALAQIIYPISIRPGGRLDSLLKDRSLAEKVDDRYGIEYLKPLNKPIHYDFSAVSPEVRTWDFVAHWTRSHYGPWPGEGRNRFYARILDSRDEYPNNAFNTLLSILREGKIRASSEKIRDGHEVIGFSSSDPLEMLKSFRWHHRRVNWNFEPYAIAVKMAAAKRIGIRPVSYGATEDYRKLCDSEKPFFQNLGGKEVDWSREREWRHIGDLHLKQVGDADTLIIVWKETEADLVRKEFSFPVLSLT